MPEHDAGNARDETKEVGAIVIAPTRELATQVHQVLEQGFLEGVGLTSMLVTGGGDPGKDIQRFREKGGNVVVGTPGRLLDLFQFRGASVGDFNFAAHVRSLEVLVLDEADKLLEFGFATALDSIISHLPKQRRTGLFSATQTQAVQDLVRTGMRNPVEVRVRSVGGTGGRDVGVPDTLTNYYTLCAEERKLDLLAAFLREKCAERKEKVLVFVATCACVDYFGSALIGILEDVQVLSLHGRMRGRRYLVFDRFRNLESGVLVCTDVMARGIDIPDIDWVVQFDPPSTGVAFVHRAGRTARSGSQGSSLLFLLPNEQPYVEFLLLNQKVSLSEMKEVVEEGKVKPTKELLEGLQIRDRAMMDKANRAFVSFIQFYCKHPLYLVFQLKEMNLGKLAQGFGLLRMPRMPEFRALARGLQDFQPSSLDLNSIPYR
ncbi:unnamed protein product [Darwinula stevensoni]|uniref:ATP-dependent RNA helicase n=1 Tax=Darwinula stevensoni TaxID=69355 RepID=A0A7R8XDV8_9CRUS|nr:unnamed protein product [Darwinula stevensoni]CAG0894707.1 unnamed protein product [Darwinula stevensoni]